jgi:C-terminal processing protease CtpA/Prc
MTVGSFAPDDREQFLAFTRDAFTKLRQAGTALLLVDISTNGGGDDATWLDGLMPYLATSAYRTGSNYKKKVIEANAERGELPGQVVTGSIATWRLPQPDNPMLFRGKTHVVIGPATYSSAVLFANVMHDFGFGTLVGNGGARVERNRAACVNSFCPTRNWLYGCRVSCSIRRPARRLARCWNLIRA